MSDTWGVARLANKIDWEGGITDAIEYGISSTDIEDPKLAEMWARAEAMHMGLGPVLVEIEDYIADQLEDGGGGQ